MMSCRSRRVATVVLAGAAVCCLAESATADFFRDVARGLQFIGFSVQGTRNPLTGGAEINVNRAFARDRFDFGVTDLLLDGTFRSQLVWGRRPIPTVELRADTAGTTLSYTLRRNVGLQDFLAEGEIQLGMDLEANALGFYDLYLQIANNGTFETDGLFGQDDGTLDFDIGPIDVSGQIFADLLAALTDRLFTQAGLANPFEEFSLRATRQKMGIDPQQVDQILQKLEAGQAISDTEAGLLVTSEVLEQLTGQLNPLAMLLDGGAGQADLTAESPEPSSLLLLLPGLLWLRRR